MGVIVAPLACFIVGFVLGAVCGRGRRGEPVNLIFTRSQRGRVRFKYEHAAEDGRTVVVSPSSCATVTAAMERAPRRFHVVKTINRAGQ